MSSPAGSNACPRNGKTASEERELVRRLHFAGWTTLLLAMAVGLVALPADILMGLTVGGFIATINLALLHRAVIRIQARGPRVKPMSVLPRYYLSFAATAAVVFVLISRHVVNPVGLVLGLGVFLIAFFVVAMSLAGRIVYQIFVKEAA